MAIKFEQDIFGDLLTNTQDDYEESDPPSKENTDDLLQIENGEGMQDIEIPNLVKIRTRWHFLNVEDSGLPKPLCSTLVPEGELQYLTSSCEVPAESVWCKGCVKRATQEQIGAMRFWASLMGRGG